MPTSRATAGGGWIDVATIRLFALAASTGLFFVALSFPSFIGFFAPWGMTVALALVAVAALTSIVAALRGSRDLRALLPYLVLVPLANIVLAIGPTTGSPGQQQPWTLNATIVALCAAPLVLRRPVAGLVMVTLVLTYAWARSTTSSLLVGVIEGSQPFVGSLALSVAVGLVRRRFAEASEAEEQAGAVREAAAEQEIVEVEQRWWELLIHDKVLGALLMASRSTTLVMLSTARALAVDALGSLDRTAPTISEEERRGWTETISAYAAQLGLRATVTVSGSPPPENVVVSLLASTREALTNVARHAGVQDVTIDVGQSETWVLVTITDAGAGFDAGRALVHRMGVSTSIPGHMRSVGGRADIDSALGRGTKVTLTWAMAREAGSASEGSGATGVAGFTGVAEGRMWSYGWLTGLWNATALAGALVAYGRITQGHIGCIGFAIYVMGYIYVHFAESLNGVLAGGFFLTSQFALLLATPPSEAQDWRLWYFAGCLPAMVLITMTGHALASVITSVLMLVNGLILWGFSGPSALRNIVQAGVPLLIVTLCGIIYLRALERATRKLRFQLTSAAESRAELRASTRRAELSARQMEILARTAMPLLEHLASGAVVTSAERTACRKAEARTRDHLVAGAIVSARIEDCAASARDRGAKVVLTSAVKDAPDEVSGAAYDGFARALEVLLDAAGDQSDLVARWQPASRRTAATLVLSTPAKTVAAESLHEALSRTPHQLDLGEDAVFVELAALSRP